MESQINYEKLYKSLSEGLDEMHQSNVRKTKTALKSLFIVPTVFLILLFLTDGSKSTFLTLWLASFFIIACILIVIEYQDYKLRLMIVRANEDVAEADSLRNAIRDHENTDPEYTEEETEDSLGSHT